MRSKHRPHAFPSWPEQQLLWVERERFIWLARERSVALWMHRASARAWVVRFLDADRRAGAERAEDPGRIPAEDGRVRHVCDGWRGIRPRRQLCKRGGSWKYTTTADANGH